MHGHAFLGSAILSLCLASGAAAQQSESAATTRKPEQSPSVRQSAMSLVEEALAGTASLTLPENRLAIELRAFPILWSRSDARARALAQQMVGEFAADAVVTKQDPDRNPQIALNILRTQRNTIARGIAHNDPEIALLFLSGTQAYLDDDPEDHALAIDLAAQVALHDPRRALQLAEQQLKESDDLPPSMIELLTQIERNDPTAGAHLFGEIVDHLHQQNLADDTEALSFAASLLANQFSRQSEAGQPDSTLRPLADAVATAVLNSDVAQNQPYTWNDAMSALDALVPSKSNFFHPMRSVQTRVEPGFLLAEIQPGAVQRRRQPRLVAPISGSG